MTRRPKYGNRKTESDGHIFDSKLEARCYQELRLRERAGEIDELELQVRVPLQVGDKKVCAWVVDFEYYDHTIKKLVWLDAKGLMTPVASLKIKLAKALYPNVQIEIWKG